MTGNNQQGGTDMEMVEQMIHDLEDGVITKENHAILMDLIKNDPAVCEIYFEQMETVALLKQTVKNRDELGTMPVSELMISRGRRRSAMVALTYGVAALLILSIGFLIFQVSQRPADEPDWIVMDASDESEYEIVYAEGEDRDTRSLKVGDKIELSQGLLRFSFPSGVKAIIEGPSRLELTSDLSVKMDGGLAWFKVPEAGHGFTVQTEWLRVVDLGTEFGVWFDDDEYLQVHVAKGRVRVESKSKNAPEVEIVQNKAMKFDILGNAKNVMCSASTFRREFTRSMPYLHWSFDSMVDGRFEAKGTVPGVEGYAARLRHVKGKSPLTDKAARHIDGRFGKAFAMDGNGVFAESAFPGVGGSLPRTVAMWVRHRGDRGMPGLSTPYCVWGSKKSPGRLWKITIKDEDGLKLYAASQNAPYTTELASDIVDRWVHLTIVYTGRINKEGGSEVYFYVNGVRRSVSEIYTDGSIKINTDISSENSFPVRFGAATQLTDGSKSVDGDLDEVYIFRGVLNEAQVGELMKFNHLDFFIK